MEIIGIPAFTDNYIWLYCNELKAFAIDPGEAEPLINYIERQGIELNSILLTHRHLDHVGGVKELKERYPDLYVYGPSEVEALVDQVVSDGDELNILGQKLEVFKTNGHTEEHVSYLMGNHLFSGDALFSAGCGRVFTGDYESHYRTMQWFKSLPDEINVYPAHEYTVTNLTFASKICPDNSKIKEALRETKERFSKEGKTLPSTIGREKKINVFLLADNLEEFIDYRLKRDKI